MAYSDKELVARARRRVETMEKYGVENDALKSLKNSLDIFYNDFNVPKTSKSGISITKKMSTDERQYMRSIIRQFMNGESGIDYIEKKYDQFMNKYYNDTQYSNIQPAATVKEKAQTLDYIRNVMTDRFIAEHYDSEVLNAIYYDYADTKEDADLYRKAFIEVIKEDIQDGLIYNPINEDIDEDSLILGNYTTQSYKGSSDNDYLINRIYVKAQSMR